MTASQSTHLVYFIHFPAVIHRVKSEVINSTQWSCWSNNSNFKNGAIICFLTAMQTWQFKTAYSNYKSRVQKCKQASEKVHTRKILKSEMFDPFYPKHRIYCQSWLCGEALTLLASIFRSCRELRWIIERCFQRYSCTLLEEDFSWVRF